MTENKMFDALWTTENGYVDCTPKQYRDWLLEHGTPIMVRGYARDLQDKRIGPGVIRVSKVPLEKPTPPPKLDLPQEVLEAMRCANSDRTDCADRLMVGPCAHPGVLSDFIRRIAGEGSRG
jgi:hypothetical protein